MDLLAEARQGNRVFRITFPSGERVPFRLLSWKDFNQYWELFQKDTIPEDIVENVIFERCCLDVALLDRIHEERAGIVSTVVKLIMYMSGPSGPEAFDSDMMIARALVDTLNSQIVITICKAFPAYKPEDILSLSWAEVLIRLAQAERILMRKDPPELTEPVRILTEEELRERQGQVEGEVDTNQLIKDGRKDAAEMGARPAGANLTDTDIEIGREAAIRQQRRAMARRFRG